MANPQGNYNLYERVMTFAFGERARMKPTQEMGSQGFTIVGGYVQSMERNPALVGQQKYITASDILANVAIVAASIHYFANLVASPEWKVQPAKDRGPDLEPSDESKRTADFIESCMYDMEASWHRIIRRTSMFRYYGFGLNEWTAKRRTIDGRTGFKSVKSRPQHTVERWDFDPVTREIAGVWQVTPNFPIGVYIPRKKLIYVVDDTLTDSPEGFGLVRHLAESAERYVEYLKIEGQGFERDFRGVPVGRAPLAALKTAVDSGAMKKADADSLMAGLREFVQMQAKGKATGLVLDSATYKGLSADGGQTPSSIPHWALELLTGSSQGIEHVGAAINRIAFDMATILGTEGLLMGKDGGGNRSLGEDKSRNLYLMVNSCVKDIGEAFEQDWVTPLMELNGIPEQYRPTLKPEDVSFRSVESIAATLRDMSTAGAVIGADDPVVNDVRDLLGVSRQPDDIIERTLEREEEKHELSITPKPAPVTSPVAPLARGK